MALRIYLLGQFQLQAGMQPIELRSRPAQSLLAYLVLNAGATHRREKLAGLLWPDSTNSNARNYLRQALWRIRQALTRADLDWEAYLKINNINVTFISHADYWIDVQDFLKTTDDGSAECIMESLRLYQGDLLPGFYDEWIAPERERLQAMYQQKMGLLLNRLCEFNRWQEVIAWGEEWVRQGYAPEGAFRAIMRAHARLGNHGMVSATYQRCLEALDRELSLTPSLETRQLYDEILQQAEPDTPQPSPRQVKPSPPRFLEDSEPDTFDMPVFVARDRELTQLEIFLSTATSGKGQVVFITGEVGSGKSTLLQAFTRHALQAHPNLLIAGERCNAHTGIGDPYFPFREILALLTGDVEARWAGGTMTREHALRLWRNLPLATTALLGCGAELINTFIPGTALLNRATAYGADQERWLNQLRNVIQQIDAHGRFKTSQQVDLFEQYWCVLQALTREHPILLFLDDLQWADAGSINLLFHIARKLSRSPLLIVGAYRQEEIALGRQDARHPLEPVVNECTREFGALSVNLEKADRRAFIDAFLDSEPNCLHPAFRTMLFNLTRGNPLFTIELLRGMQERGDVVKDQQGRWIEGATLDWETMPARVEAVIAERIGRLDQTLQRALQIGSVEGEVFTVEALAQVMQVDERDLLNRLNSELDHRHRLIRAESIQRLDGQRLTSYRFRHILSQKFLYSNLNKIERIHLHEEVGKALENLFATQENIPLVALQLARHFEKADIPKKTIAYLHHAGERAIQLSAFKEGISHFSRGLEILEDLPASAERDELELTLQLSLGMAWKYNWSSLQAKKAIDRASDLCQALGKNAQLARIMGEITIFHYVHAEYRQALEWAQEALLLAQQEDDPILMAEGHWYLGFIKFCLGEYEAAYKHLTYVMEFYDPQRHHDSLVSLRGVDAGLSAMAYASCCLWCLGYPEQAHALSQEALTLAYSFQHSLTLADVLCYAGCMLHTMLGDPHTVQKSANDLFQIAIEDQLYLSGWSGMARNFIGVAKLMQGQAKQAIEHIDYSIKHSQTTGISLYHAINLQSLAQALALDGQTQAALDALAEALAVVEKTDDRHWEAELYRLRGDLMLANEDEKGAEASYQQSLAVARRQGAKSWELRTAMSLSRLWMQQDKGKQAHAILEPIYAWFTEGFDTPDLKAARLLLEEIS